MVIVAVLVAILGVAAGMVLMHRGKTPAGVVKRGKGSTAEQADLPADPDSPQDGE